jgi:radical SAM superfamily enzyme YgiQ (UPF0313 family)
MCTVLLIVPPGDITKKTYSMCEVGAIAGVLSRERLNYAILDCSGTAGDFRRLKTALNSNPIIVSIFLSWESDIWINQWSSSLVFKIRKIKSDAHINCAGRAATVFYKHLLKSGLCDSVIRGETAITLHALIDRLLDRSKWQATKGIAYAEKPLGKIVRTPDRFAVSDLDAQPWPAYDYLQYHRKYPIVPICSSRICQGECLFCYGRIYRSANSQPPGYCGMRSAESIVQEMKSVVHRYGTRQFYFVDDNFIPYGDAGKTRADEIASKIIDRGLKVRFSVECRASDIELDTMKSLKKAGLHKVFIGFESGADSVLRRYRKGTTAAINLNAVNILRKIGIGIDPGFIMFDPWTRFEELQASLAFIEASGLYEYRAQQSIYKTLSMPPGSELEQLYKNDGGIHDKRVDAIKRALTHAKRLVHHHGLLSSKQVVLPLNSPVYEKKRRYLMFHVFKTSIDILNSHKYRGIKGTDGIDLLRDIQQMVAPLCSNIDQTAHGYQETL